MNTQSDWYSHVFKSWQTKLVGPKPTAEMLATVHRLQARPGKQALAIAMGMRDCGVTGSQIVIACGAPQLNKMRGFIDNRLLKRLATAPDANNHTVYKLELTPKGQQRVDTAIKREAAVAEAEKGEAAAKPVKAKAKPAKAPAKAKGASKRKGNGDQPATTDALSEPATATVTVTSEGAPFEGNSMTTATDL